jgi:cytosine/adenosine deaminase-related metal-dependent hydrolase
MATLDGAEAMGLDAEIGSLEPGKRADVIVVNLSSLHSTPHADRVSALVYSAATSDVSDVIIDGRLVLRDRELLTMNEPLIFEGARREAELLRGRAGIEA